MRHHLVGDVVSFEDPPAPPPLAPPSWVRLRLKSNLANDSSLALTNGDFSVCSWSECSCSELADRTLRKRWPQVAAKEELGNIQNKGRSSNMSTIVRMGVNLYRYRSGQFYSYLKRFRLLAALRTRGSNSAADWARCTGFLRFLRNWFLSDRF